MSNLTEREYQNEDRPNIVILNSPDYILVVITIISISGMIASLLFAVYLKTQQNNGIVCGQQTDVESDAQVIVVTPTEDTSTIEQKYIRERLCTPPRPPSADKRIEILEVIEENPHNKSTHLLRPPIYAVQFCHKSMHQSFGRYLPEVQ